METGIRGGVIMGAGATTQAPIAKDTVAGGLAQLEQQIAIAWKGCTHR